MQANATALIAGVQIIQTPLHMKTIIDAINVNNPGISGIITMSVVDVFTQDVSQNNNAPTPRTAIPFNMPVGQGVFASADKNSLAKMECLGAVAITCDKTDPGCNITVIYHQE